MNLSIRLSHKPTISTVGQLFFALFLGIVLATQQIDVLIPIIGITILILLATVTPLVSLIILLILAPLRTLIATESAFQLPLDIGQLLVVVFIGYWFLSRLLWRQSLITVSWSRLYIPVVLFITVTGVTAFNAVSLSTWVNEWLKWIIVWVLIAFMLDLGRASRWEWIVFGLVAAALANAIIGLYIFFGGSGADHLLIMNRFFRAFGTFGQPNPFGGFMGLVAPISLMAFGGYSYRLFQQRRIYSKLNVKLLYVSLFYGFAFVVIMAALFASWSRGAWLGFVVSMGVVAFALPRNIWRSLLFVGVSVSIVALLWLSGILPQSVVDRVVSSTEEYFVLYDVRGVDITPENFAVVERLAHWQAALNMARAQPLTGVGFGNYEVAYEDFRLINWVEPLGHAHNYYLNILAEAGIMGALAYLVLWVSIIWLNWKARNHPDALARFIIVGLLGSWAYLSFHSLLDNLYVNNLFLHIGVMLGILAILCQQIQQSTQVEIG